MRRLALLSMLIFTFCESPAPVQREPMPTGRVSLEGLWNYQGFTTPENRESTGLSGLFLFHRGRFLHQAMRIGHPQDSQLADMHAGTYRTRENGITLEVELGVVVDPSRESLLASRSNTAHDIGTDITGETLRLTFGNGTVETLRKIETTQVQTLTLDSGFLALSDTHFVLVAGPGNEWLAGSGTYRRQGNQLLLQCFSWVEVVDNRASYARDELFEVGFDGQTLTFPSGRVIQVR